MENKSTKLDTDTTAKTDANTVLVAVTPEMIKFAEEYALWIVTVGQNYINAISPKFTTAFRRLALSVLQTELTKVSSPTNLAAIDISFV